MSNIFNIAIVGCGYVADYYMATLSAYPRLNITGVFDIDKKRLEQFSQHHQLSTYGSLEDILNDSSVDAVLNLTNPRAHYEISKRALEFGKHVYSEKPLAMSYEHAEELVDLAKKQGLQIVSAPCSVLGKSAKTLAYAVEQKLAGDVRLVYAELDDGMVHKMPYQKWQSESGAYWPYRDEFEVGCILEHAGYYLSWLVIMFGNVSTVTAFSDALIPDKIKGEAPLTPSNTADTSIGILKFESGVVVRLTTTIVGEHDHQIRIFGEKGIISMKDCWDNNGNVYVQNFLRIRRKFLLNPIKRKVKLPYKISVNKMERGNTKMDFLLGVNELAQSIEDCKPCSIGGNFSLHINEVALALQYAGVHSNTYIVKSKAQ